MDDARPEKFVLIGLDGVSLRGIQRYLDRGLCPTLVRLMREGVVAPNCMAPFPTITPPNWTTIVTGAWPGTHGVTGFWVHKPGTPLDETHCAVTTEFCQSEYIWDAAAKVGKRTIVMNYPASYGAKLPGGIRLGGDGLSMNESAVGLPPEAQEKLICSVCNEQFFAAEQFPRAAVTEARRAEGWRGQEASLPRAIEAEIHLYFPDALVAVTEKRCLFLLVPDPAASPLAALLCGSRNTADLLARLELGKWSEPITSVFRTRAGEAKGRFRAKLLNVGPAGENVRLYLTPICRLDGYSEPEEIPRELYDVEGLPMPGSRLASYTLGWVDADTYGDLYEMMHQWYAAAAERLMAGHPWDLFIMHAHGPDWLAHRILEEADPLLGRGDDTSREAELIFEKCYASLDGMIARILKAAGEKALCVVVSDHGNAGGRGGFPVARVLEEAGLLYFKKDPLTGRPVIDWSRTKAAPQREVYVYVNLKGRDPQGIVEPGGEYEEVCERAVRALVSYLDPATGLRPVALALAREDARLIGLYGDRVGDIVYAVRPPFGSVHGQRLTTAAYGSATLAPLLIMQGPGLRKNVALERNVWLTDLVPTVCHLMEIPVPSGTEGAIIYQALEEPHLDLRERAELARRYEELQKAYDAFGA